MTQIINNQNQTFSVLSNGVEIFTGSITDAMQLHAKLSYAARTPAKVSVRKAARLQQIREQREAGR